MFEALNDEQKDVVRRALSATVDGPFFPDWEFHTLFGIQRSEMRDVLAAFPNLSASNQLHFLGVNNALFMLASYPIKEKQQLEEYGLELQEVADILKIIRVSLGKPVEKFLDFAE